MTYTNPLSHITMDGTTMDIKDAQAVAAIADMSESIDNIENDITTLESTMNAKFAEQSATIAENTAKIKAISASQWVSVLDYGADNTGAEDSTQAFIDAIAATPVHGTVYIPIGEYKISSTIDIKKPITILGDYTGLDVEYASSAASSDDYKRALINSYCQNIPAFEIYGGGVTMENLGIWQKVENGSRIISISQGTGSAAVPRNNHFTNIWINGNYGGSTYAAIGIGTNGCNLITSTFDFVRIVFVRYGFVFGASGMATTSLQFSNCWVEASIDYGYQLQTAYYCAFTGCAVDGYAATPHATGGYAFINCEGISMSGCGAEKLLRAVQLNTSNGVTMVGCAFAGIDNYGAQISGDNVFSMIGCSMLSSSTTPIALVSSSTNYNLIGCIYQNISIDGTTTSQPNQNHINGIG